DRTKDIKQLHALYDTLKKKVRKDNHDDRVEKYKTGGGTHTPEVTETGTKLLSFLAPQFEPLDSPYDSSSAYYENGNQYMYNFIIFILSNNCNKKTESYNIFTNFKHNI
ncbi:hypothetical protein ANN_10784, partial [Periplaneta americana]